MGLRWAIVEKWNAHAGVRQDLFGIIDIIALDPKRGVVGIQCCGVDFSNHLAKITRERSQNARDWLSAPGAYLELWSWSKVRGSPLRGWHIVDENVEETWALRIQKITLTDLSDVPSRAS
jgi:hypothetical protein